MLSSAAIFTVVRNNPNPKSIIITFFFETFISAIIIGIINKIFSPAFFVDHNVKNSNGYFCIKMFFFIFNFNLFHSLCGILDYWMVPCWIITDPTQREPHLYVNSSWHFVVIITLIIIPMRAFLFPKTKILSEETLIGKGKQTTTRVGRWSRSFTKKKEDKKKKKKKKLTKIAFKITND